jgi:hypothetical protein
MVSAPLASAKLLNWKSTAIPPLVSGSALFPSTIRPKPGSRIGPPLSSVKELRLLSVKKSPSRIKVRGVVL